MSQSFYHQSCWHSLLRIPLLALCAQAIAKIVSSHMGGAYGADSEAQMQQRWAASSAEVRRRRGRPIVPAAQLRVGLGVHRALLFKFLADASNVPCRLIGSGACEGEHLPAAERLLISSTHANIQSPDTERTTTASNGTSPCLARFLAQLLSRRLLSPTCRRAGGGRHCCGAHRRPGAGRGPDGPPWGGAAVAGARVEWHSSRQAAQCHEALPLIAQGHVPSAAQQPVCA